MHKIIAGIVLISVVSSCSMFFDGYGKKDASKGLNPLALINGGTLSDDAAQDQHPFLFRSKVKNYLFFSSDRAGSNDIYYAEMSADGDFYPPVLLDTNNINSSVYPEWSPVVFTYNGSNYITYLQQNSADPYAFTRLLDANMNYVANVGYFMPVQGKNIGLIQDPTNPKLLVLYGTTVIEVRTFDGTNWNFSESITNNFPIDSANGFSKDGVDYYIASSRKDQFGVQQLLYGSSLTKGVLTPIPFYASDADDFSPFVDTETYKVYFASTRYGLGNYDLYRYNLMTYDLLMSSSHYIPPTFMTQAVYVSTNGSDINIGTNSGAPMKTISAAIARAAEIGYSNVFVAMGTYTPGNGLDATGSGVVITNNNLMIWGGWDPTFTYPAGYSELDGANTLYHVVSMINTTNVTMYWFVVKNGNAIGSSPGDCGAGLYLSNVTYCGLLMNTIVSNGANSYGGGVYMIDCYSNYIFSTIVSNHGNNGGGIYMLRCDLTYMIVDVVSNYASAGNGGGICMENSIYSELYAPNVCYNSCSIDGGGIYMTTGAHNMIIGAGISNNTASGSGGGISVNTETNDTIDTSRIYGNTAGASGYGGGGLMIGIYCTLVNVGYTTIDGNISLNYGGGIEVYGNTFTSIMNCYITNNYYANASSGEIHLRASVPGITGLNINNCTILGTNATATCCGIYEDAGVSGQTLTMNQFDAVGFPLAVYYHDSGSGDLSTLSAVNNPVNTGATLDSTNNY